MQSTSLICYSNLLFRDKENKSQRSSNKNSTLHTPGLLLSRPVSKPNTGLHCHQKQWVEVNVIKNGVTNCSSITVIFFVCLMITSPCGLKLSSRVVKNKSQEQDDESLSRLWQKPPTSELVHSWMIECFVNTPLLHRISPELTEVLSEDLQGPLQKVLDGVALLHLQAKYTQIQPWTE